MAKNPVVECWEEISRFIEKHGTEITSKFIINAINNVKTEDLYYERLENKIFNLVCSAYHISKEEIVLSKRRSRTRKYACICLVNLFQTKLSYKNTLIAEKLNKHESLITQYTAIYSNIKLDTKHEYEQCILRTITEIKEKLK